MSAFKSHKRKSSIKNESGSPDSKNIKIETIFQTPNKTPKQEKKTPKNVNQQQKGTPGGKPSNKKTPNQIGTPKPKIEMFQGTGKLNFKTPNSAAGTGKKNIESESAEVKENRHKKRRALLKGKRHEKRAKFLELKAKAIQGDESAKNEIRLLLAAIETDGGALSKTKRKKLAVLTRILNNPAPKNLVAVKPNKKVQDSKKVINQNVSKKQHNGKSAQTKQTVKVESDEEDEEASEDDDNTSEDGDEQESTEDKEESAEENEDEEESAEDEEAEDDDEESEDEDGSEEEQSDEEKKVINNKKSVVQKNIQQVQKQTKQKNKPDNQVVPKKAPAGAPFNKSSRYVVFVGNMPYTTTDSDLREHFKKVGEIADVRIPTNQDNKPRGFAYVELKDETTYQKALSLHNTFLGGRKINVLYTQGGKKKSENQKGEMKAKNFKLQAMRKQGQLQGSVRENQKRSARRGKNQQKGT